MNERYQGPVITKIDGPDEFTVWRDTTPDDGFAFSGFFNKELSVTANDAVVALRALWRKHRVGLPEGKLIDFAEMRKRLRQ